jgi:dephospho-CoA kinase
MITFGLTGGIACGKSTATKTFIKNNIPIVDADVVARQVVELGSQCLEEIVMVFGNEYLNSDGTLDRIKLGKLVFAEPNAMKMLNSIMGPAINEESSKQIKSFHDDGKKIVGYDAALICEMGNADKYRPLIVVSCPRDTQLERLMSRNSLTRAEAVARIDSQMPVEKKIQMADYVIDTSGSIEESIKQTESIIHKLRYSMYRKMLDNEEITYNQIPYAWKDCAGNDFPDE